MKVEVLGSTLRVAEHPMEISRFTPSQESAKVRTKNEENIIQFFDFKGTVHRKFVPPSQTTNEEF
jgi:hypothetical protein